MTVRYNDRESRRASILHGLVIKLSVEDETSYNGVVDRIM